MTHSVQGIGENWHTYIEGASAPPDAQGLAYKQSFRNLIPDSSGSEPVYNVWGFNLTVGQTQSFYCDAGVPDFWFVSLPAANGITLGVVNSADPNAIPLRIAGGGKVKLPARSEYVSLIALAGTCQGNVIATRNIEFEIDPGKLA